MGSRLWLSVHDVFSEGMLFVFGDRAIGQEAKVVQGDMDVLLRDQAMVVDYEQGEVGGHA